MGVKETVFRACSVVEMLIWQVSAWDSTSHRSNRGYAVKRSAS